MLLQWKHKKLSPSFFSKNVGSQYPVFGPILELFSSGPQAAAEFNRLTFQLLPSGLATAGNLVRLQALAGILSQASWQASLAHILNTSPSGTELISALIRSQFEVVESTSGSGGSSSTNVPAADISSDSSYGSIREQSIGDALPLVMLYVHWRLRVLWIPVVLRAECRGLRLSCNQTASFSREPSSSRSLASIIRILSLLSAL